MDKEIKNEYSSNTESGFDDYFDKWPNWLRWMAFIPTAFIVYLIAYYAGYFSMYWFYGEAIKQGFVWNTYRDIIFVIVPLYIIHECAPKHKFVISTVFAAIYIIIAVAGITINIMSGLFTFELESFFTYMLPQLLAIGASVYFIIISAKHKFNYN